MIFITVKFRIRPERSHEWLNTVADFTAATRAEDGNLFFEWAKATEEPHVFYLIEAFRDAEAGAAHVDSAHFTKAMDDMSYLIAERPQIVSTDIEGPGGWGEMGETAPRDQ